MILNCAFEAPVEVIYTDGMGRFSTPIRRVIFGTIIKEPHIKVGHVPVNPRIESILARPSWSVKSLLPSSQAETSAPITKGQLHHLLKLSALPLPKSEEEEARMIQTLQSQIHFVNEVQKIDTANIEPLVAIRDESVEAVQEQTITLEKLKPYLEQEVRVGNNGTIRRSKSKEMITDSGWDPFELGHGKDSRKLGKYFFVKKSKDKRPKDASS